LETRKNICERVTGFIRDKLKKEEEEIRKRRANRMKQKWRSIMKKNTRASLCRDMKFAKIRDDNVKMWKCFESIVSTARKKMRCCIDGYMERASKKRKELKETLMKNAMNVKRALEEMNEKYRRKISINNAMKVMYGSIDENEVSLNVADGYDMMYSDWYQRMIEKQFEMNRCFEKDNIFVFSKNSWELLKNNGPKLKHKGGVINNVEYKVVKKKLKEGINLD
jgi:hypothetical protein